MTDASDPDDPRPGWQARIAAASLGAEAEELGSVAELADGVTLLTGLPGASLGETLVFEGGCQGFVLSIEPESIRAAFLDPSDGVRAGSAVRRTGQPARVPVGEAFLGRVIDPLGRPLDGLGPVAAEAMVEVERAAPEIIERDFVSQPVETGLLVIDALFAIGRGQRELIIGERATGKTSIAVDAILNQRRSDVVSVYVAIGERLSAVERVIAAIRAGGAMDRTIFVVAAPTAAPALRWMAPFAGTTIAERFRDRGGDALVVYDDLTRHAAVHRELALLAEQPPGREAFPGDIFYLHARLLERSAKLSVAKGGGSMTALPIAEIEAGNLAGYIPTNLISICDGQIVLSPQLFAANQRPAVDIGLSVSRVGGKAQRAALKQASGHVRLDYAQYLELKMFARFGGFSDPGMAARIERGERIGAILAQARFSPLRTIEQVAILLALEEGLLDRLSPEAIPALKEAIGPILDAEPTLADEACLDSLTDERRALLIDCMHRALDALPQRETGA